MSTMLASDQQPVDVEDSHSESDDISKDAPAIGWKNWLNLVMYIVNSVVTYTSLTGIFGATNTVLSNKYQTLVTPAGWAFSIWGPIFIWEGVFVVAQFFPTFRACTTVVKVSPWWWGVCFCQSVWTLVFAQEWITAAMVMMFSILVCLLGISWSTDGLKMSVAEYFLLSAPLSLHLGWIIVASTLSVNVEADAFEASQDTLLALAILSNAAVLAVVTAFTLAVKSPNAIIGLVATWAFLGIRSELHDGVLINDPSRFNPSIWSLVTLGGLAKAAVGISVLTGVMAAVAALLRIVPAFSSDSDDDDKE